MVPPRKKRVVMTNPNNFRSVDSYELEGDAREAYAEWLKDMNFAVEVVSVLNSSESVSIDDDELELIDFA
tara:strand:- start:1532 stop:1741 length:210 start_codon:yes stop_codon:yes gene_type:complete